ncbi:hypothetical protein [uncultured Enterococcus sp.]|uniref:hypothetical protein n=1 Tax=uncultured Enterococcus sp. TaxID=167972 RepID=UPI002AA960AC|nr:hypothetical protein [uncultured Enterococcus sp.]
MTLFTAYLKDYWYYKRVGIASKVNGLIYYFQRIPFIGKFIPQTIYKTYGIKQALSVLGVIFSYVTSFSAKFFWLALYYGAAILLSGMGITGEKIDFFNQQIFLSGLFCWWLFVPVFLGFYNGYAFSAHKPLVDFIDQFNLSRTIVVRGHMIMDVGIQGLAYIPAGLVYGALLGRPIEVLLFILFTYWGFNYLFLYLGRFLYTLHLSKKMRWALGSVVAVFIFVGTGLIYWQQLVIPIVSVFVSWIGVVLFGLFFAVGTYLLLHFKQENEYLLYWINQATVTLDQAKKQTSKNNYISEGLAMQRKLEISNEGEFSHLQGSQYLNALLFSRYRTILNKALRLRFLGIAAALVAVIGASLFGLFRSVTAHEMTVTLPILFFLMYLMTFGKKVVQMVFVNCDVSMLYYPFYREASTIISGFNYRFKQTLFYNGLLSVGIFSVYLLLSVLNNFFLSWDFFAVLLLLLLALSALFSFHELFVYYLIQPFSGDMEVVSPLYKIISGVFYWISYMNVQVRFTGFYYALTVSVLSLLYVGIGFIVIYKKAPQTFRIKG